MSSRIAVTRFQRLHWMTVRGKRGVRVVGEHVLAFGQGEQVGLRLAPRLRLGGSTCGRVALLARAFFNVSAAG